MTDNNFVDQDEEYLSHYGIKQKSGRYPWGSGENPFQHDPSYKGPSDFDTPEEFYNECKRLEKEEGLKQSEIGKMLGIYTGDLRTYISAAEVKIRNEKRAQAINLSNSGMSLREIAKTMGMDAKNESTVRQWLNENTNKNRNQMFDYAKMLKEAIDKNGPVDVGKGVDAQLGISATLLDQACTVLAAEYGYFVGGYGQEQVLNKDQQTNTRVAGPKGMTSRDLYHVGEKDWAGMKIDKISSLKDDGFDAKTGKQKLVPRFEKPGTIARNRVKIMYAEDGGTDMDGVIELRPGVPDLSLGGSHYSQVRIAVDNEKGEPSYYLKGMAIYNYNNDLPEGIDILVHSNKSNKLPDKDVFKRLERKANGEVDWDNPFKSAIKPQDEGGQYRYVDKDGNEKIGAINKRADEGDWNEWSKKVPSQFLSKQNKKLIHTQLDKSIAERKQELQEIMSLQNPAIRIKMLNDYAGSCETQAEHLHATAFPRQRHQVILPVNSLKDDEVYAPNFNAGEKVALIRFPHAGTFEIPILTVTDKNSEGDFIVGKDSKDAVGINTNNATRLSGADFDGDTVLVIPITEETIVTATESLAGLKEFSETFHQTYAPTYKYDDDGNPILDEKGDPIVVTATLTKKTVQTQMGEVSNLLTDMTSAGAPPEHIARAVKHSMVVIDSVKHKLDYKQSEVDNGIAELKQMYQKHDYVNGIGEVHKGSTGASTIISRAKSENVVPRYRGQPRVNKETGELYYPEEKLDTYEKKVKLKDEKGRIVKDEKGNEIWVGTGEMTFRKRKVSYMSSVKDARELVKDPNNEVEMAYATYANQLKALTNEARKEAVNTPRSVYNPEAYQKYATEVADLNAQYNESLKNAPRERQANRLASMMYREYEEDHGEQSKEDKKKLYTRMLNKARDITGAKRYEIQLDDKKWEAIQAGAISHDKLSKMFEKCNQDQLLSYAMPKEAKVIKDVDKSIIDQMAGSYTTADIARRTHLPVMTITNYLAERRAK